LNRPLSYTSTISNTGSLLEETFAILGLLSHNSSIHEARTQVIENNLFGKKSEHSRQNVWANVHFRYIAGREAEFTSLLAKTISSRLPDQVRKLILFFEFAQADALIYDLTTKLLFNLYQQGRSLVTKEDIVYWLQQAEVTHPEIQGWSPQTRVHIVQHFLAIARDFGLLEGELQKYLVKPFIPVSAFVWVLYRLKDVETTDKAIIEAEEFQLFMLAPEDVKLLLSEASQAGYISFRVMGDVYDLSFRYTSLHEVVNGFATQVH
jgi:hypothetical protein